jgi:hypothetical protein
MAQLSYVHGASGTPLIGETIGVHFDKVAERCGERAALVSRHQQIYWSYRALKERVEAFAVEPPALGILRRKTSAGFTNPSSGAVGTSFPQPRMPGIRPSF